MTRNEIEKRVNIDALIKRAEARKRRKIKFACGAWAFFALGFMAGALSYHLTHANDAQTREIAPGAGISREDILNASDGVQKTHRTTEEETAGVIRLNKGLSKITGYCACEECTGKTPGDELYGITATGTEATAGRTLAVCPHEINFGTVVEIDGVEYIAEDTGADLWGTEYRIYFDTHEEAVAYGTHYAHSFILHKGDAADDE